MKETTNNGRKMLSLLLALVMTLALLPVSATFAEEALPSESYTQEATADEAVLEVQALIDALPTLETVSAEDYDALQEAYDRYELLQNEQKKQIAGAEIFEELFQWFSEQTVLLGNSSVSYLDADGATQSCEQYTTLTAETTTLNTGWYVASGTLAINNTLTLASEAEVHLILEDGATLTVQGIKNDNDTVLTNLTIYAQSKGGNAGKLVVSGYIEKGAAYGIDVYGNLTVNGGVIEASTPSLSDYTGSAYSTAISVIGSHVGTSGIFTVNGASVTASAGDISVTGTTAVSYGVLAFQVPVRDGGALKAFSGDVSAMGDSVETGSSVGVSSLYEKMEIDNATLEATAGTVTVEGKRRVRNGTRQSMSAWSLGILLTMSDFTVSGESVVRATAKDTTVTRTDNEPEETADESQSYAIFLNTVVPKNLEISGGSFTLAHGTASYTGGTAGTAKEGDMKIAGDDDSKASISGGSLKLKQAYFKKLEFLGGVEPTSILASGSAYATTATPFVLLKPSELSSDAEVQIVECTHQKSDNTPAYENSLCPYCGEACPHKTVNNAGLCSDCNTQLAVSITNGSNVIYYSKLQDVASAVKNGDELKLLQNITDTKGYEFKPGKNAIVTINLNGKTLTVGSLTLKSGAFTVKNGSVVLNSNFGSLMACEKLVVEESVERISRLNVQENAVVSLYGGSYGKIDVSGSITVFDLLPQGYAYKDSTGNWVAPSSDKTRIENVTVKKIPLTGMDVEKDKENYTYGETALLTAKPTLVAGVTETISYKWYRVSGSTETVIPNETSATLSVELDEVETFTYKCVATADGYSLSDEISFAVGNATLTDVSVRQTGTLTYDGTAQRATVSASATAKNNQTVSFSYSTEENGTYAAELPRFTNADSYTVYYKANATNHVTKGGSFTVEIEKATLTVNPEKQSGVAWIYRGQALSEAKISTYAEYLGVDNQTVTGNYAWADNTEIISAPTAVLMRFTDQDGNYEPAEFSVSINLYSTGGGHSKNSNITTTTTKNADGSVTTITTNKITGTVTEVTKNTDGSTVTIETKKDGTVTTVEKDQYGNQKTTVERPNGTLTISEENKDGSEKKIEKDAEGNVTTTEKDKAGNTTVSTETADGSKTTEEKRADGTTVKTETAQNGETTSEITAPEGEETEVDIPVDGAEKIEKLIVTDQDGNRKEITDFERTDSGVRLCVSGSCFVECVRETQTAKKEFADVHGVSHWASESIDYVYEAGLMNGITENEFKPDMPLTRAMLVTILYRAANEPMVDAASGFGDIASESYYAKAVAWAEQNDIVSGVSETEFAPDENITREQIATIIYRFAKSMGIAPQGAWAIRLDYADISDISDYAVEGVMYCTLQGIMQGKDNHMFAPKAIATRAEIAAILQRLMEKNK